MKYKVASIVLVLAMLFWLHLRRLPVRTPPNSPPPSHIKMLAMVLLPFNWFSLLKAMLMAFLWHCPIPQMAGTSIYVGSVGDIANGFKGSAVLSSDQPLVSTLVQVQSR